MALRLREYLNAVDNGKPDEELQALRRTLRIDRILLDIEPLVDGTLEGATRVSEIVQDLRRFSSSQTARSRAFDLAPRGADGGGVGGEDGADQAGRGVRSARAARRDQQARAGPSDAWSIWCRTPSTPWKALGTG